MANHIAAQMQKKIDSVQKSALALDALNNLCMQTDHGRLDDFRFLLDYLSHDLLEHVYEQQELFKKHVFPYLADIRSVNLG